MSPTLTLGEYLAATLGFEYPGSDIVVIVYEKAPVPDHIFIHYEIHYSSYKSFNLVAGFSTPRSQPQDAVGRAIIALTEHIQQQGEH